MLYRKVQMNSNHDTQSKCYISLVSMDTQHLERD